MSDGNNDNRGRPGRIGAVVIPAVLVLAGAAGIIYAVGWHTIPVVLPEEPAAPQETVVPAPPDLQPAGPPGLPPGETIAGPPGLPPAGAQSEVTEPEVVYSAEGEIIRETTRGGVTRNEDGEIVRTYTGEPPEACPT